MTIKKIIIIVLAVFSIQLAQAQGSKVSTASFLMSDYEVEKNSDDLLKAKKAIDEASKHESTMNNGKTWYYRGLVHYMLSVDEITKKDGNDYTSEALKSFEKALTIEDKRFRDDEKVLNKLKDMAADVFNVSVEKQKASDFKGAHEGYKVVEKINDVIVANNGKLQFDVNQAIQNGTYTAAAAGLTDEAISGFNKLIEVDPKDTYYFKLANLYKKSGDTDKYLETLDRGNKAFPDNGNIIIAQLNHLRSVGKTDEALAKIDKAIELQPENAVLYFVKAKSYDDAGEKDKAIEIYEQALTIDPEYTDAMYNIGAIHFLSGNPIVEKMNGLSTSAADTKIYNELVEERKVIYRKAKTFFERILEIKPDDANSISTLKKINRVLER